MSQRRVAVVGGGISGLAAALAFDDTFDVTLYEASSRLGGPVNTVDFAGLRVDTGPDSFLARRPEMIDLATSLGLGDTLVAPSAGEAGVWSRGKVRTLPKGLVLGVPRSMGGLARSGIVSPLAVGRAALDRVLPATPLGDDFAVGDLVRKRFGRAVQERLVDPLLGGIHAGRSERLSAAVGAPQLLAGARNDKSLMRSLPTPPPSTDPVFLTVPTGLGSVVDAAKKELETRGATIRLNIVVSELQADGTQWMVNGERYDGVVLATPAGVTARLLVGEAPDASAALSTMEYASVTLTLLAYPDTSLPEPYRLSGYLVPRPENRLTSAISWASAKWAHLRGNGMEIVRVSTGRIDDRRHESIDDVELVARLHEELVEATGLRATAPSEVRICRWPSALPQFKVDHLAKVAKHAHSAASNAEAPLRLAGSTYEGLGLPACVASGRAAAKAVSERVG